MAQTGGRLIRDQIYGHIYIREILFNIIDHPLFQRLRDLKQLGATSFVFPSTTHTRFEHSLGVSHLAKKWMKRFQRKQPELQITDEEVLLCEIAGLCHDLGHGPLSHAFEKNFSNNRGKFHHENMSVLCLRHIFEADSCKVLEKFGFSKESGQLEKIEAMIQGVVPESERVRCRSFMYQIVSNSETGIDVDRFDYLKRDSFMSGLTISYDPTRTMKFSRVVCGEIAFRDREAYNVAELFNSRYLLYRQLYGHRVSRAVEMMIMDALCLVDEELKISKWTAQPSKYHLVTDSLLQSAERLEFADETPDHQKQRIIRAQKIISRVRHRDIYSTMKEWILDQEMIKQYPTVELFLSNFLYLKHPELKKFGEKYGNDISYQLAVRKHYSNPNNEHPIERTCFFEKHYPNKFFHLKRNEISQMIADANVEHSITLYWKISKEQTVGETKVDFDNCMKSLNQ